jgi:broad specificity phosphatase PhoE
MNVFVMRHGETAWSVSGRHTGTTDLPLTDNGWRLAERLRPVLEREEFERVFVSPMRRARETCELAGLGNAAIIDDDLAEWNYGEYEGLTPEQIHEKAPHWLIFRDGCPDGEMPTDMYSAPWWHGGLDCDQALESISCSIRALCAFCPTTTNFPLSGCGMAL